jgi:ElaB/YqjD/DUF883 family membrane-anchored ribosome-binding protein
VSGEIGVTDRIQDKMVQVSDKLTVADQSIRKFARERPITAILTAVTIGYVVGRVLSRL